MEKWGIVFDSSCNFSKEKVLKDGHFFVPLIININGENFKAGEDIDSNDLFEKMKNRKIMVKTSTPESEDFKKMFRDGLKKYEKLIYIGLSKLFTSSYNTALVTIKNNKEFQNKVFVYDSLYSAPWTELLYEDITKVVKNSNTFEEITKKLDYQVGKMVGFLSPGDIYWFYKGGRVTRNQYIAANLLKIKPILTIKGGKILDNVYKVRTLSRAVEKMMELCNKEIDNFVKNNIDYKYLIVESNNQDTTEKIINILKENYKNIKTKEINILHLSPEQSAHMGPNSFGIGVWAPFPKSFFKKEV